MSFSFKLSSAVLIMIINTAWASTLPMVEQIQLPVCLASKLAGDYKVLAENADFKIIELPATELNRLALLADEVHCGRFLNVSHQLTKNTLIASQEAAQELLKKRPHLANKAITTYEIKHQKLVTASFAKIDLSEILHNLEQLTRYYNRSALSVMGARTATWLKNQVETLSVEAKPDQLSIYFVKTKGYKQPSLVTVISEDIAAPAIVIGAHMDTLDGRMPGAIDDGSGSALIMEMLRILLESELKFKRPIYVIWYAAEERGLVGSQFVVEHFLKKSIPVEAVIQFDMAGYRSNPDDPTMWLLSDYTDPRLNQFIADLIATYIKVPVNYTQCGYGCSDHASWTAAGIPAVLPFETSFDALNPYIHSAADTMDLLNNDHLLNFTKLALAFAIELGMAS